MKDKKHLLNSIYYNDSKTIYNEKIDKNDSLRIRKTAPAYTQYWDAPQKNIKRCKICVDSWYNGKILSMMAYQHKATKEVKTWYYLDIENAKIYKKKEALRYLVNHKLPIKEDRFVECTKSQAIKKLKKILDI